VQNHSEWKGTVSLSTTNPEIKAGTRGSSMGIDALTMAAISKGSSFFQNTTSVTVNDQNHILAQANTFKWVKYIDVLVR
tara:strand:- start:384 stop:620 length:237 start_codon:yes stop_codon:yes gene_type:complete